MPDQPQRATRPLPPATRRLRRLLWPAWAAVLGLLALLAGAARAGNLPGELPALVGRINVQAGELQLQDRDSGQWKGQRFISGGRDRPRRMLYLAALSAKRCDAGFKRFADGLTQRGKPTKVAIVAVMRKLIEAANLVLSRSQPWVKHATT